MKIYIVRHGKTQYNIERRTTGHVDVPLVDEGIKEAIAEAKEAPKGIVKIYSSDLLRCKQTAEIFSEYLKVPIVYDARLRERNFGTLDGHEIDALPEGMWQKDIQQEYDYRQYGGESVDDVKKRFLSVLEDIRHAHPEGNILIVAHGGIVRLMQKMYLNAPADKVHNSHIYEFDI